MGKLSNAISKLKKLKQGREEAFQDPSEGSSGGRRRCGDWSQHHH